MSKTKMVINTGEYDNRKILDYITALWYLIDWGYDNNTDDLYHKVSNYIEDKKWKEDDFEQLREYIRDIDNKYLENNYDFSVQSKCITINFPDDIYGHCPWEKFDYLTNIPYKVKKIWPDVKISGSAWACTDSVCGWCDSVVINSKKTKGCKCLICQEIITKKKARQIFESEKGVVGLCSADCEKRFNVHKKKAETLSEDELIDYLYRQGLEAYDIIDFLEEYDF